MDYDPLRIEETVVRKLLFDMDERLAAVNDPVLPGEDRLIFTDGKYPAGLLGCRYNTGMQDLPAGLVAENGNDVEALNPGTTLPPPSPPAVASRRSRGAVISLVKDDTE